MRRLGPERDGVDLPNDFRNWKRGDEANLAFLARGPQRHARQVVGVLSGSEIFAHVVRGLGAGCLLELYVGMLLGLAVQRILEAERRAKNDLVAVADQI